MAKLEQDDGVARLLSAGMRAMRFGMEAHHPPSLLYHFTDAAGAIGILTKKALWASRAMSLNDASEIEYGIARTKRYVADRIEKERSPKRMAFLRHTMQWLDGSEVNSELIVGVDHFVTSFCGRANRSGLWLHYGRSGRGYALGFDSARLAHDPFELLKVIYDPKEQDALIDGAIRIIEEEFLDLAYEQDGEIVARAGGTAAHLCATSVRAIAVRIKDPCFDGEEEWRLSTMNFIGAHMENAGIPLKHGYRACDDRIVPYLISEYESGLPISELIVGFGVDLGQHREL